MSYWDGFVNSAGADGNRQRRIESLEKCCQELMDTVRQQQQEIENLKQGHKRATDSYKDELQGSNESRIGLLRTVEEMERQVLEHWKWLQEKGYWDEFAEWLSKLPHYSLFQLPPVEEE